MLKIDRHSYILDELKTKHLVRVSKLAHDMKVTEMTIRRDLQELEDYGHLTRIHGGAKLKPKNFYQEDNYNKKISVNVEEKKQIARKVADLIKDNETIFIGPGSTTSYLAEFLQDKNINIVTNSLTVFEQFKDNPSCDLIFIGGRYRQKTKGFIGYFTQDALSKISVNKVFVGVSGIDLEKVTISDEEEGRCNETILNNATERYVLADHSKFSTHAFYTFFQLKDLTAIISDDVLDENIKDQYRKEVEII